MVKLLKRAIITEWKKYHNVSSIKQVVSSVVTCRDLEKSLMCWEEWLWTCRTLQYRLYRGIY